MKYAKVFPNLGVIEFDPLKNFSEITHFFTTRQFGNMALHVATTESNLRGALVHRERACQTYAIDSNHLVTAQQVHGDRLVRVRPGMRGMGAKDYSQAIPDCDGLLTAYNQVPLAIFVADCLPLYIYDYRNQAIALVHAGKKGTQLEIARKALKMMEEEYQTDPKKCLALLGPAIGPCCLDLDLYDLNRKQLYQAGLMEERIYSVDTCTSCESQLFYSYRREKEKAGRMMALLMIK